MNGRKFFKKYSGLVMLLVKIVRKLPTTFRRYCLSAIRSNDSSISMFLRYLLVKTLAKNCGDNVAIFPDVYFKNIESLSLGSNVSIHQMCYIDAEGGINIGNNVSIAHRSTILSSNHLYDDVDIPIKYQGMNLKETNIDENVWIGCSCVILAGTRINHGSIVAANSTVTKIVPPDVIVGGTPATVIKSRFERKK